MAENVYGQYSSRPTNTGIGTGLAQVLQARFRPVDYRGMAQGMVGLGQGIGAAAGAQAKQKAEDKKQRAETMKRAQDLEAGNSRLHNELYEEYDKDLDRIRNISDPEEMDAEMNKFLQGRTALKNQEAQAFAQYEKAKANPSEVVLDPQTGQYVPKHRVLLKRLAGEASKEDLDLLKEGLAANALNVELMDINNSTLNDRGFSLTQTMNKRAKEFMVANNIISETEAQDDNYVTEKFKTLSSSDRDKLKEYLKEDGGHLQKNWLEQSVINGNLPSDVFYNKDSYDKPILPSEGDVMSSRDQAPAPMQTIEQTEVREGATERVPAGMGNVAENDRGVMQVPEDMVGKGVITEQYEKEFEEAFNRLQFGAYSKDTRPEPASVTAAKAKANQEEDPIELYKVRLSKAVVDPAAEGMEPHMRQRGIVQLPPLKTFEGVNIDTDRLEGLNQIAGYTFQNGQYLPVDKNDVVIGGPEMLDQYRIEVKASESEKDKPRIEKAFSDEVKAQLKDLGADDFTLSDATAIEFTKVLERSLQDNSNFDWVNAENIESGGFRVALQQLNKKTGAHIEPEVFQDEIFPLLNPNQKVVQRKDGFIEVKGPDYELDEESGETLIEDEDRKKQELIRNAKATIQSERPELFMTDSELGKSRNPNAVRQYSRRKGNKNNVYFYSPEEEDRIREIMMANPKYTIEQAAEEATNKEEKKKGKSFGEVYN